MDGQAKTILQRIIRKIPNKKLEVTLKSWDRLSTEQLESLDCTQPKWLFLENLISRCGEKRLGLKAVTKLEMVYYIDNPNQGTWQAFQLMEAEDDAVSVSFTQFRERFKANLEEDFRHISIRMKKLEDGAIWIRIAWGDNFRKPNHLKPTYVVHYLQTPYVFFLNFMSKHKPFLYEALFRATRHTSIKEAHLSGRSLTALRDLVMRQYQQVFPTKDRTLKERNGTPLHPNIEKEHAEYAERRHQMACEAFGDGILPKLERAVYKLETRYRGNSSNTLNDKDELFRGVVKFSSSNLLQSFHHCVATGIVEGPVTPLLSSITQKGKNYFVITDKVPGATH
ncbi:centromere protein N [Electrophorus electricus]|uniref:Centromere protein N n=1 Tax=Electrophorus electricus TaxID=8005 RepID=A0A4W4GDR7_ELEEL|nr:centromere protein N [Electrophorus electricus]